MKIPNPITWLLRAKAAPLLAERCNLLEERIAILTRQLELQSATLAHQLNRNNLLARRNLEQMRENALQAQAIEALHAQIEVNRALLAVVMRERDEAQASDERHGRVLATMQKARREEKQRLRLWLSRCVAIAPGRN